MLVKAIVLIVVYLLYWYICSLNIGTEKKNMISYRAYPDIIQEKLREDPELSQLIPQSSLMKTLISNIILFTVIFLVAGIILKLTIHMHTFKDCMIYFLIMGEGLNIFDLIVMDLLWWRHSPKIRFKNIPDDSLYLDMKNHIASFKRAVPIFLIVAVIVSFIISIL